MKLTSSSFENNSPIPARYAFCALDDNDEVQMGDNVSPAFNWRELPDETQSLVLICHDPDVPSQPDDVNKEGRTVPEDLPRIDFYHWVLVDLSPELEGLDEGDFSDGVTERGKDGPEGPHGTRQGLNDYTNWFAEDEDMSGDYYGYDGPCPPWNDSIVHHYHFTLYALDVDEAPVEDTFTGDEVLEAIEDHVLDEARVVGLYSLNPDVPAEEG